MFHFQLKGCPSSEITQAVDEMLESVDLMHKKYEQAKTLSGGMKRKLSVGIALIWGSKVRRIIESYNTLSLSLIFGNFT